LAITTEGKGREGEHLQQLWPSEGAESLGSQDTELAGQAGLETVSKETASKETAAVFSYCTGTL